MPRKIKPVKVGGLRLDGDRIYIQSMLNARSDDIDGNVTQALELQVAGCEILRVAVPDTQSVILIEKLKNAVKIPIVADIHFNYKIALECVSAGVDKIRINPGNIGDMDRIKQVANACKTANIPIRIGVNSGSLEKEILAEYGSPTSEALAKSALKHAELLEQCGFDDIVISIKSSNVKTMINANRLLREKCEYPLHLGVTEAGTERIGIVKSAVGIGSLLADGIGETIRVSLTADPVREIYAAIDLLKSLGLRNGVNVISCPTCGRTKIDVISLANRVEKAVCGIDKNMTVAVMGCAVNGPGEAREADFGIAGGDGEAVLFRKGVIVRKIPETEIFDVLLQEIIEYSQGGQ